MRNELGYLEPIRLFEIFEEISRIPRESGKEKGISDYLIRFAQKANLEVEQDELLNITIRKTSTKGYENSPIVIMQSHMDMVCSKLDGMEFDFDKTPIPLYIEGDAITARGTSLGADNGIGMAMILGILEDDKMQHPKLIAIFTVDEERSMAGAAGYNQGTTTADIFINLDSEYEGAVLTSSAGGVKSVVEYLGERIKSNRDYTTKIKILGLKGGHSGVEIDKNRGNAIRLLGRVLYELGEIISYDVISIDGGEVSNSIPKNANAVIVINATDKGIFEKFIETQKVVFENEFSISDPGIEIQITQMKYFNESFSSKGQTDIIALIRSLPCGIQSMSSGLHGLVESSVNIGTIRTSNDSIIITNSIRSSVKSLKNEIVDRINILCQMTGAKMKLEADYPAWQYKSGSLIVDVMKKVYKKQYGKEMTVEAVHAGVECGFFSDKFPGIDMVSIGPNLHDVHTPNEVLEIESTRRTYYFLRNVLKELKNSKNN